ncbi:MAG TPA: tetratricopeptide repeat protein [Gemmatimonadaceae bacterium]|nr:tetratricopeptide repeat protein [Gemmatimonadaceae bacterium]
MSKVASLKKKAADLEKKSPEKAVDVYVELCAEMEKHPDEMDVAIFNRLGDILVKARNVADAADYYEKAVDYYAEGGFVNNAIALCNKILRVAPGRSSVYYKLGRISAQKGFIADAKQNFLEYADRMQKLGRMDEAFRALGEFADLCPDQTDIRLMLADQLAKAGKKDDAIEQLQILHEQLDGEGRSGEAQAAAERLKALDPSVEPRAGGAGGGGPRGGDKTGDLIFIDLGDTPAAQRARQSIAKRVTQGFKAVPMDEPKSGPRASTPAIPKPAPPKEAPKAAPKPAPAPPRAAPPPPPAPEPPPPVEAELVADIPLVEPEPFIDAEPVIDAEHVADAAPMAGLESTSMADIDFTGNLGGGIELEPTSLIDEPPPEPPSAHVPRSSRAGSLDFIIPDGADMPDATAAAGTGEFPMLDDALIMPDAADTLSVDAAAASDLSVTDASLEAISAVSVPPIPDSARPSSYVAAAKSVEMLQAVVDGDPEDWASRRELAEALLEAGNRESGVRELETAMSGFERSGDLATAMSVADEIVRLDPSSVKHHQKRVEYAYRTNDRPQLIEAYLELADALFRSGQVDKSRTIYQRVLELAPDDLRAQAALSTMPEAPPEPPPAPAKRTSVHDKRVTPPRAERKHTPVADDSFVNLGDWLREDDAPKDTRMVVAEEEPTGNEEADFADMLKKFKQGVAENVEAEDYQSHYDLGVAYKEMGLVDEAIAEFQKALRGPDNHVKIYEAIGQCFIEKGQHAMAATILGRALGEKGNTDDALVGVLYLLGRANEATGKLDEALAFYQRVFVVDIQFHDVADRLNALENAAR